MPLLDKHFASEADRREMSTRELADLFLGDVIGRGISRNVYAHRQDPTLVIKHESGDGFANQIEWNVWNIVKETPWKKWFAPCVDISPCGLWLIQKKVEFPSHEKYPAKMPYFFTDFKYSNYGRIGKQWVACDYGDLSVLISHGLTNKLKKAHWWKE